MAPRSFGQWLKDRRRHGQLTQDALGQQVGCAGETIRKIEANRARPSSKLITRILQIFDIPAAEYAELIQWARTGIHPTHAQELSTPILGRDHEIAEVVTLLQQKDMRLITLVGPPGVGKTRLALAVVAALEQQEALRIYYLSLAQIRDSHIVLPIIARTMGITKVNVDKDILWDQVVSSINRTPCILVLDNLEHLLVITPLLRDLLQATAKLTILATSRVVLQLIGEYCYPVCPLPLPSEIADDVTTILAQSPAVQLFVRQVQTHTPDFSCTATNATTIATLCRRLDGLPLAIELAAARVRDQSVDQLLVQLDDRFAILSDHSDDTLDHQHSLQATLDWSYRLLPLATQEVFARTSLFVGMWSLDALTALCEVSPVIDTDSSDRYVLLKHLARLCDHHLLERHTTDSETVRFSLLESVRAYAHTHLIDPHLLEMLHYRYVQYYLTLAETANQHMLSGQQTHWLPHLRAEQYNLQHAITLTIQHQWVVEALRLSTSLWWFWQRDGYVVEGWYWFQSALQAATIPIDPALQAAALNSAGGLAYTQGWHAQAQQAYRMCLQLSHQVLDIVLCAKAITNLGRVAHAQGQYLRAARLYRTGLHYYERCKQQRQVATTLIALGTLSGDMGNHQQAVAYFEASLPIARAIGDPFVIGAALGNLGYTALLHEDEDQAQTYMEASLPYLQAINDVNGVASMYSHLGWLAVQRERIVTAMCYFAMSFTRVWQGGYHRQVAECIEGIATVYARLGVDMLSIYYWGVADTVRKEQNAPLPPLDQARYERESATVRERIAADIWHTVWEQGTQQPLDEVVAEALGDLQFLCALAVYMSLQMMYTDHLVPMFPESEQILGQLY